MGGVTTVAADAPASARPWSVAKVLDLGLALLAHAAVGLTWLVTAAAVMGSLDVGRRMVMNSEFAFDTGRLPQPWVIPLGLVGIWVAHRFFGWSMRRFTGAEAAYGPSVIAWCGVLIGVALGAYLWTPPLQVGAQVGPASGQYRAWGVAGWAAYWARLALPALIALVTAALVLFSRQSPLVVLVRGLLARIGHRRAGRRS